MSNIRNAVGRTLDQRIRSKLTPFEVPTGTSSSVIFAPHPDDETLGCGGLAHKMIASGAKIQFVFVTDGTTSHARYVAPDVLRKQRESEAIEAVSRLGASADQVTFLRFVDGRAIQDVNAIPTAIIPLLKGWQPQNVFVTHAREPSADHIAVNTAVRAAIQTYGRPVTVFEYPIWYWYHWPWVRFGGDLPGMWPKTLRQTVKTIAGLRAIATFNTQTYIGDVLDVKRDALSAHASQMERPIQHPDWPILADLSGGEFLKRLLSDYEVFTRYEVNR